MIVPAASGKIQPKGVGKVVELSMAKLDGLKMR